MNFMAINVYYIEQNFLKGVRLRSYKPFMSQIIVRCRYFLTFYYEICIDYTVIIEDDFFDIRTFTQLILDPLQWPHY